MKDSRKHPRVSIAVEVDLGGSGSNFYAGRTRDISMGGLFVETNVPLPIGTELDVKLKLPKGTFTLRSEIVWMLTDQAKQTVGVGVRFLGPSAAAKRAIEAFMAVRHPVDFETAAADDDEPEAGPPPLPPVEAKPPTLAEHPRPPVIPEPSPKPPPLSNPRK
jgi:uncharacterized protein (TIGR02266 family)